MRTHEDHDGLDDRTAEALVAGTSSGYGPDADRLASFVAELRSEYSGPGPVPVRTELAEIFAAGVRVGREDVPAADGLTAHTRSRRRTVLATLSAFVATLTGKILLGTAAAAAGVSGAHAAGVVDVPGLPDRPAAVEDAPSDQPDNAPDVEGGQPDSPGVDGSDVADRATSGEPQEDGKSFGRSVADEAVEGTPAEDNRENRGDAADDHRPDTPVGGSGTADDQRPDAPSDAADVADEHRPDEPAVGDTGGQPDQPSAGGADTAEEHSNSAPTAVD